MAMRCVWAAHNTLSKERQRYQQIRHVQPREALEKAALRKGTLMIPTHQGMQKQCADIQCFWSLVMSSAMNQVQAWWDHEVTGNCMQVMSNHEAWDKKETWQHPFTAAATSG
jgi:hypothetical protein